MKICENGVIRDMTAEEEAQYAEMAAREAAEAKHRPIWQEYPQQLHYILARNYQRRVQC